MLIVPAPRVFRLCKHREKNSIAHERKKKKQNSLLVALAKNEILTSVKVLKTTFCTRKGSIIRFLGRR